MKLPWPPGERLASGGDLVWVTEAVNGGPEIIGIDARTGTIVRRFAVGSGSVGPGIAYGAGSLWLSLNVEVVRVDPRTGRVQQRFRIPSRWVTFADGAAWAASSGGLVSKIDPVENRSTARARLHGFVSDLTVGGGFVWVAVVGDDAVYKLSEDDLSVQRAVPGGRDPERLSFGGGHLWIANTAAETVSRARPRNRHAAHPSRAGRAGDGRLPRRPRLDRGRARTRRRCRRSPAPSSGSRRHTCTPTRCDAGALRRTSSSSTPPAPPSSTTRTPPVGRGPGFAPRSPPRCRPSRPTAAPTPSGSGTGSGSRRRRTSR